MKGCTYLGFLVLCGLVGIVIGEFWSGKVQLELDARKAIPMGATAELVEAWIDSRGHQSKKMYFGNEPVGYLVETRSCYIVIGLDQEGKVEKLSSGRMP